MSKRSSDHHKPSSHTPPRSSSRDTSTHHQDNASENQPYHAMPSQYNRVRVDDLLNPDGPSSRSRGTVRSDSRRRPSDSPSGATVSSVECDVQGCKRKFPSKDSMKAHQKRSHPAPTNFICDQCQSSFSTPPNLNKHIRSVHEKRRPFKCSQCNSSFAFKDGLYRHTRMVHDQLRPYPCTMCTLRFKTRSHLVKHCQALHPRMKQAGASASVKHQGSGDK